MRIFQKQNQTHSKCSVVGHWQWNCKETQKLCMPTKKQWEGLSPNIVCTLFNWNELAVCWGWTHNLQICYTIAIQLPLGVMWNRIMSVPGSLPQELDYGTCWPGLRLKWFICWSQFWHTLSNMLVSISLINYSNIDFQCLKHCELVPIGISLKKAILKIVYRH